MQAQLLPQQGPSLNPLTMVPAFLAWAAITIIAILLHWKGKMKRGASIALLAVSLSISGFLLGAMPNPLMPLQQIFVTLGSGVPNPQAIIPLVVITSILVATGFLAGRAFCGHACPLGALQELAAKVQFTGRWKKKRRDKTRVIDSSSKGKVFQIIRLAFTIVFVVLATWVGAPAIALLNPFTAFQVFHVPFTPILLASIGILAAITVASFFVYRPWCRLFCPFGLLASLTSRFSILKFNRNEACNDCGSCERACPTGEANRGSTGMECYQCGECVSSCPVDAVSFSKK